MCHVTDRSDLGFMLIEGKKNDCVFYFYIQSGDKLKEKQNSGSVMLWEPFSSRV